MASAAHGTGNVSDSAVMKLMEAGFEVKINISVSLSVFLSHVVDQHSTSES